MDQLSWQKSSVDERGGKNFEPPSQYTGLESLEGRQLCPCLLPAARHSSTWLKHIWNLGHDPTMATKGLLASGDLQREPSCLFWDTREAFLCLHMKDILKQSFPAPLRMGSLPSKLIKCSEGYCPLHPRAGCVLPTFAALLHGQLENQGAEQFLAKGSCLLIYTASVHWFTANHSQLWSENATAPFNTRLSQES